MMLKINDKVKHKFKSFAESVFEESGTVINMFDGCMGTICQVKYSDKTEDEFIIFMKKTSQTELFVEQLIKITRKLTCYIQQKIA